MEKLKAPSVLPVLKIPSKKNSKIGTIPQSEFTVLNQVLKLVPLGSNPITELGLKWRDKQDYEQIKYILQDILEYPSVDLADLHRDCNRLGIFDILENQQKLSKMIFEEKQPQISCKCCGYVLQSQQIPIFTPLKDIGNMGISTHLYFSTLINICILLIVLFLVYGIFALVTNIICYNQIKDQLKDGAHFLTVSLSGKQLYRTTQSDYYYFIQAWLGLVVVLIWIGIFIIIKYFEKNDEILVDNKTISAADFTIVIEGVPAQMTKNQLQKQLDIYYQKLTEAQKPKQIDRPFKIAKINKATPFYLTIDQFMSKDLKQTLKQKTQQRKIFQDWIIERQQSYQFSVPKQKRLTEYNKFRTLENQVEQRYANAVNRIVEEMRQKNKQPITSVYVTFQSHFSKQLICYLNSSKDQISFKKIFPCFGGASTYFTINHENLEFKTKIKQAPEPEDIIWTNIGQSYKQKLCRKIITYTVTAIFLGGSFTVFFYLSQLQVRLSNDAFLSFIISLSITLINLILQVAIRILTNLERQQTYTNFQTGLAVKSIVAQVINSVLLPFIVKYFIEGNLYKADGLAFVIFTSGLINSFLLPLLAIININHLVYKIKYWIYQKIYFKLKITQSQLNQISILSTFQIGNQYIYPVNLFIFICFYVSLQPLICVFGIGGLILMYITNKYILFTKSRRPSPGNDFINRAMYRALETGPFIFSLGNLVWSNLVINGGPSYALAPNLISITIAGIFMIIPYKGFFSAYVKIEYGQELLYSQKRIFLTSQYDRLNPMTAKQSIIEYSKFLREFRQQIKQKKQQDLLLLKELMLIQKQKGQIPSPILMQIFASQNLNSVLSSEIKDVNKNKMDQMSQQPISIEQHHLIIKQDGIEELKVKKKRKIRNIITPKSLFKSLFAQNHTNLNVVTNWAQQPAQRNQNKLMNSLILQNPTQKKRNIKKTQVNIQNPKEYSETKRQIDKNQSQQINYEMIKNLFLQKFKRQDKKNKKQEQNLEFDQQNQLSIVKINPKQKKNSKGEGILSMILDKGGILLPQQKS